MYYIGTLEEIEAVNTKMCDNCGIPSGNTTRMVDPIETATSGVFVCVEVESWGGYTKDQVNAGITQTKVETVEFPEVESE